MIICLLARYGNVNRTIGFVPNQRRNIKNGLEPVNDFRTLLLDLAADHGFTVRINAEDESIELFHRFGHYEGFEQAYRALDQWLKEEIE